MKREYRRWTEAEKEAILQMYIDGYTFDAIAQKYGESKIKITSLMYRMRKRRSKR